MEQATYAARLRYLDAADLDDTVVDFDGLDVRGPDDQKLGDIDGFIVDSTSGRMYYAVVDSGGWFTSRRFLLPIGHVVVDGDRKAARVDVTRDALERGYPEFDEARFRELSDDELRTLERRMVDVCCPGEPVTDVPAGSWPYETRSHYRQPEWWRGDAYRGRLRPIEPRSTRPAGTRPAAVQERYDREQIAARHRDDVSPHLEGRAQPGDILGIETGGERTHVGETAEDEDKRRRDAERAAVDEEPRRSER